MKDLKLTVALAIMMGATRDILNKTPDFVKEKLDMMALVDDPRELLEGIEIELYDEYLKKWGGEGVSNK